jgi:Protein required for attachment to host cells
MVASPRAPGMIRLDYSVAVRKALHGELDKGLVKKPVREIEKTGCCLELFLILIKSVCLKRRMMRGNS